MTAHVFTYGSLTFAQVMRAVIGDTPDHEPALLPGYARYGLRGESYPGLVPEDRHATDGVLWRDLPEDAIDRLDAFEGDWYQRTPVQVLVGEPPERRVDAATYVLRAAQHHRLNRRRWSRDRFEQHALPQFLKAYGGFAAVGATDGA